MFVRRLVAVTGVSAGLVLLGGPVWADETPSPDPGDPSCFVMSPDPGDGGTVSSDPGDGGSVDPTDEPTVDPTDEATVDPTDEATVDPTDEATVDPTDDPTADPTVDPTDEPTVDPTDEPSADPSESPVMVCMADGPLGSGFTGGGGHLEKPAAASELPFNGAPVAGTALLGLTLLVGGTAVVVGVGKPRRT